MQQQHFYMISTFGPFFQVVEKVVLIQIIKHYGFKL